MNLKDQLGASQDTRLGTTSSSPYTGSPTFEATPFQVEVDRQPPLGTYAFVEHMGANVVHYGRIIGGTEENPRADPARLQQNQAYQVGQKDPRQGGDRAPHVTRVMSLEVLGQIELDTDGSLKLKEPGVLPQTGMGVYELPADKLPWLLGLPDSPDDGLNVGTIDSGAQSVACIIPSESMVRQTAIVGKTGVGKSYAVGVAVEEYARLGIPVISFDVLGDLNNACEDLKGRNYRAGDNFKVHYAVVGTSEIMGFFPNLTKDQSEIVALSYETIYNEAISELNRSGNVTVKFQRFYDEIETVARRFGQEAVGTRAMNRVKAILGRTQLLSEGIGTWLNTLANTPLTNVFVGHLGQRDRNLIVAASARLLQNMRRRDEIPPFMLILDESHFFLPGGGDTTASTGVIRELVRTARHHAIGIVLITQSPGSMDKQALLTCNTRIVFALDKDDLRVISGTMGDLSDALIDRIPKMAKGTAIISSSMDIIRHPVFVRIRRRQTREGAPTPNMAQEVKNWRQRKTN